MEGWKDEDWEARGREERERDCEFELFLRKHAPSLSPSPCQCRPQRRSMALSTMLEPKKAVCVLRDERSERTEAEGMSGAETSAKGKKHGGGKRGERE
jgi:hypothetical protein